MARIPKLTVLALAIIAACTRGESVQPSPKVTSTVLPPVTEPEPLPDPQALLDEVLGGITAPTAALVLSVSDEPQVLASSGRNGIDPFMSTFRPGSTVKPLLAVLAADRDLLAPLHEVDCDGTYADGFFCFDKHGRLDLRDALMVSCNTYFFRLADDLGYPAIMEGFRAFGLGATTGLASQEASGTLPARLEEAMLARMVGTGHGPLEVSLAQLGMAYVRLAARLNDPPGENANEHRSAVMAEIAAGLRDVVGQPRGTGSAVAVPGQCVAGKTGTAEAWPWGAKSDPPVQNGLFVGFAPATAPTVVVAVLVTGGTGGSLAAPLAGEFLDRWFASTHAPAHPCPPGEDGPPC